MKKSTCLLIGAVGVGVLCLVAVFVYVCSSFEPRGAEKGRVTRIGLRRS